MKKIAILGSTGSIGGTALNVVLRHSDRFSVTLLSAHGNIKRLTEQAKTFQPALLAVSGVLSESDKNDFVREVRSFLPNVEFFFGENAERDAVVAAEYDVLLVAISGGAALDAVLSAIEKKKRIALATKEVLVMAGGFVMEKAALYGTEIFPVDSEHSAIHQCLSRGGEVKKLMITASGGAFFGRTQSELENVTPEQALAHPTWKMGKKITVDCATLMNKGLEVIEASHFFRLPPSSIEVVLHRESIIHSMVEYCDNAVIAQMSYPTMEIPVQLALTYPDRLDTAVRSLDFSELSCLHFEKFDPDDYPCFRLALQAFSEGGCMAAIMNAADEVAVRAFLDGKIGFCDIARIVRKTMDGVHGGEIVSADCVKDADRRAREYASRLIRK